LRRVLPKVGDAWRLSGVNVRLAGYTVLGRLDVKELAVPLPGSLRPGERKGRGRAAARDARRFGVQQRAELLDWVQRTAEAESNYWQGFTAKADAGGPRARAVASRHRLWPHGAGRRPTVMIEIGADMDARRLFGDWVLVHELIHTGMAFIRGRSTWFMEGAATYVEPIIRARAGWKTEEEVWREWVTDMPQGVRAFARGLGEASGRENYWGGALFMLLADVEIRRATDGAKGLEDCLGGVLWSGLDGSQRATIDAYAAICDRVTGTKVLRGLIDRYVVSARPVDLGVVWRDLGIAMVGNRIALDDAAPDARWRQDDRHGSAGAAAKRVPLPWALGRGPKTSRWCWRASPGSAAPRPNARRSCRSRAGRCRRWRRRVRRARARRWTCRITKSPSAKARLISLLALGNFSLRIAMKALKPSMPSGAPGLCWMYFGPKCLAAASKSFWLRPFS
jgi:hypothetical protein